MAWKMVLMAWKMVLMAWKMVLMAWKMVFINAVSIDTTHFSMPLKYLKVFKSIL